MKKIEAGTNTPYLKDNLFLSAITVRVRNARFRCDKVRTFYEPRGKGGSVVVRWCWVRGATLQGRGEGRVVLPGGGVTDQRKVLGDLLVLMLH